METNLAKPGSSPWDAARCKHRFKQRLGSFMVTGVDQQIGLDAQNVLRATRLRLQQHVTLGNGTLIVMLLDGEFNPNEQLLPQHELFHTALEQRLVERLEDVVVGLYLGGPDHHLGSLLGRHHDPDGGKTNVVAQFGVLHHLLTVLTGAQIEVANDNVVAFGAQRPHGIASVGRRIYVGNPHSPDKVLQQGPHTLKIVNDQKLSFVQLLCHKRHCRPIRAISPQNSHPRRHHRCGLPPCLGARRFCEHWQLALKSKRPTRYCHW